MLLDNDTAQENIVKPIEDFAADTKKMMMDQCKEWDKGDNDPGCATTAKVFGAIGGMAEGMLNPLAAIGALVDAVNTISDPEHSVAKACNQQQKLAVQHKKYYGQLQIAVKGYKRVKGELQSLGEL